MKKLLVLIFALALMVSVCAMGAMAAGSPVNGITCATDGFVVSAPQAAALAVPGMKVAATFELDPTDPTVTNGNVTVTYAEAANLKAVKATCDGSNWFDVDFTVNGENVTLAMPSFCTVAFYVEDAAAQPTTQPDANGTQTAPTANTAAAGSKTAAPAAAGAKTAAPAAAANGASGETSAKTGEGYGMMVAVAVFMMAGAAAVVVSRKKA